MKGWGGNAGVNPLTEFSESHCCDLVDQPNARDRLRPATIRVSRIRSLPGRWIHVRSRLERQRRRLGDRGTVVLASQSLLGEVVNRLHPQPVSCVRDPGILQRDGHTGSQGSLAIEHGVDFGAVESDPLDHLRALGALGKAEILDHETRVGRIAHGLGHVDLTIARIVDVVRSLE